MNTFGHLVKTNPNKPNQSQFQTGASTHGREKVQIIFDFAVGGRYNPM